MSYRVKGCLNTKHEPCQDHLVGAEMGLNWSCRVWVYEPTSSWLRCVALRPTRSEVERV